MQRAKTFLLQFYKAYGALDSFHVSSSSSLLIVNLLAKYCKFKPPAALKDDLMEDLAQGIRLVYEENVHVASWSPKTDRSESGNPLVENRDIMLLRMANRVQLAKYGCLKNRERPFTADIISTHAAKFGAKAEMTTYFHILFLPLGFIWGSDTIK